MKNEYEETITKKYFIVKCDFCEEEIRDQHMDKCCICGKDSCRKHTTYFYLSPSSDYAAHTTCLDHADMVQEAYDKIDELENSIPSAEELIQAIRKEKLWSN